MSREHAVGVSDQLLASTEYAYQTGNFEAFAACFLLPHVLGTFAGDMEIRTRDHLLMVFNSMRRHHFARGMIRMRRRTISADFVDPGKIRATYLSQQVLRGHQLSEEVVAHAVLRLARGGWKVAESHYATRDTALSEAMMTALD